MIVLPVPVSASCGPAGLLEKLLAAVRPEFRPEVLVFDPADPVFGGDLCAAGACGRTARALPNGYCQLPLVKTCPHANSCLTCPMFVTTAGFLPQHHAQRQATLQIITAAEAAGHARVAEMNRQVAANLDKIITALKADDEDGQEQAAHAS